MASSNPKQNQAHPVPFAVMRRRTILACGNCRKRKIRCITTEQPPRNPCARCVKKHLPCEYAVADAEYSSPSPGRAETPDASGSDRHDSGTDFSPSLEPMRWTPPTSPPTFSVSGGAVPPLPYTGPPPIKRTVTGWRYSPPSRYGPNHPRSGNASVPAPNHDSRASTPGSGSTHPYANPQYYTSSNTMSQYVTYGNIQYSPQHQHLVSPEPESQPPFMQPHSGDYPFNYSEFFNDYDEQGPRSVL
ncbi:hypothetical protein B0H17DRAFT_1204698 [Mycena rosella]|uniref:Zn(2)-C6 fungal-type domain-containing protein n=1 Tax=Mycena rosella TaxID=1033263 RepID=A0AAD7D8Z4_MYCRO|nr:hypothetical protein B0H17DRAFT_1204698 [Mycena rosella]